MVAIYNVSGNMNSHEAKKMIEYDEEIKVSSCGDNVGIGKGWGAGWGITMLAIWKPSTMDLWELLKEKKSGVQYALNVVNTKMTEMLNKSDSMTTKKITMVVFKHELEGILKNMTEGTGLIEIKQTRTIKHSDSTQIIYTGSIKLIA